MLLSVMKPHFIYQEHYHNVQVWDLENPHKMTEHNNDSPKVKVFCALFMNRMYEPAFFMGKIHYRHCTSQHMELWLMPQLEDHGITFFFQQDGALPHSHRNVTISEELFAREMD